LANEIAEFRGLIVFLLTFSNDLTIKSIVRFGGFVKILKDPWKLMVEIEVNSMYLSYC